MNLLHDRRIPLFLVLLLFFIPVNLYVIGEWIGTGLQWALFRYQETTYGVSLITLARDFEYITTGTLIGKTAISISLWIAGVILLILAFIALGVMILEEMDDKKYYPGIMVIGSGILLLLSCMVQYGPLFSGPAGVTIPIGIPLMLVVGWLIYSKTIGWEEQESAPAEEMPPYEQHNE